MVLQSLASHPGSRHYVLKLHRDARQQDGWLFGRLESLHSGRCFAFANARELLQCRVSELAGAPGVAAALRPDGE